MLLLLLSLWSVCKRLPAASRAAAEPCHVCSAGRARLAEARGPLTLP